MIPHNRPTLGLEEEKAAQRVLQSGWLAQGREVEAFENEFCAFLGLPGGHAVAVSSGTSALYLALWVLHAQGKRVAIPSYVCSALRNAVAMIGAEEVLLDSSSMSPNVDTTSVWQSRAPIAIIPHMYGLPINLTALETMDIIEDCAQCLGSAVAGIYTGLQGKIGIYSFYATKLMTSGGQGGMLVSRDQSLIDALRDYREFDMRRDSFGRFNFQLTDLQAAIGREQLRKLPDFLKRRDSIYQKYKDAGLQLLDSPGDGRTHPVRYRAVVKTSTPRIWIDVLRQQGVQAIIPIEDWELLGSKITFPVAGKWTEQTISLPIYPSLSDRDVEMVLRALEAIAV